MYGWSSLTLENPRRKVSSCLDKVLSIVSCCFSLTLFSHSYHFWAISFGEQRVSGHVVLYLSKDQVFCVYHPVSFVHFLLCSTITFFQKYCLPTAHMADITQSKKRKRITKSSTNSKTDRSQPSKRRSVECPVCLEPTSPSKLVKLANCSCVYCKSCLREAFTTGLSPSCFPARCCGRPLDFTALEKHLLAKLRKQYKAKAEEEASNTAVYCGEPECRTFISEATYKKGFGSCRKCHRKTCVKSFCRQLKSDHLGIYSLCPQDIENSSILKLMNRKGWKRCPNCYCMVEKINLCDRIR